MSVTNATIDIVKGLEAGADDYLTEPSALRNLSPGPTLWRAYFRNTLIHIIRSRLAGNTRKTRNDQ